MNTRRSKGRRRRRAVIAREEGAQPLFRVRRSTSAGQSEECCHEIEIGVEGRL
jgi:hypothetical protein